jgi:hypothetical protein
VIEVKPGPDFMVVWAEQDTRLVTRDGESDVGGWHATIHRELMVHARPPGSNSSDTVRLLEPPDLGSLPTPLLHVATAPERFRTDVPKQQSSWQGAVILSPILDDGYEPERTALALDLWAVPPGWAVPPHWEASLPLRRRLGAELAIRSSWRIRR